MRAMPRKDLLQRIKQSRDTKGRTSMIIKEYVGFFEEDTHPNDKKKDDKNDKKPKQNNGVRNRRKKVPKQSPV